MKEDLLLKLVKEGPGLAISLLEHFSAKTKRLEEENNSLRGEMKATEGMVRDFSQMGDDNQRLRRRIQELERELHQAEAHINERDRMLKQTGEGRFEKATREIAQLVVPNPGCGYTPEMVVDCVKRKLATLEDFSRYWKLEQTKVSELRVEISTLQSKLGAAETHCQIKEQAIKELTARVEKAEHNKPRRP